MIKSPIICMRLKKSSTLNMHFHNSYEILYFISGRALLRINKIEYLIEKNSFVFVSNLEEHQIEVIEEPLCRYFIELDPALTDLAIDCATLMSVFHNRPSNFVHVFRMLSHIEQIEKLMQILLEELESGQKYRDDMIVSVLKQIMILIYRFGDQNFVTTKQNIHPEMYEVQRFIEQHCTEQILLHELSKKYYISPCYLSRSFKGLTGYSPKEYLLLNRVSKAKELLLTTNLSVQEVAYKSGFMDINNFIRYFKSHAGVSPNKYRKH